MAPHQQQTSTWVKYLLLLLLLLVLLHFNMRYEQLFMVVDVLMFWNKLLGPLVSRWLSNGFYFVLWFWCCRDQFWIYFCNAKERIVLLGLLHITIYGLFIVVRMIALFLPRNALFDLSSNMYFMAFWLVFLCLAWGCIQVSSIFSWSPQ